MTNWLADLWKWVWDHHHPIKNFKYIADFLQICNVVFGTFCNIIVVLNIIKKSLHLRCIIWRMSWDLRWTFNLVAFCMRIHYGDFFQSFFMKWKIGESHFLQVILQVIWCTSFYNMWNQRCVVQAFVEQMKRVRSLFYFSSWEQHDMNIFCWILLLWP